MPVIKAPDPQKYSEDQIAIDRPWSNEKEKGVIPQHQKGGGDKPPANTTYGDTPYTKDNGKPVAKEVKNEKAPNANNATTASADPQERLPQAVNSKDPNGQSQVLMNMMKSLLTVAMMMSMGGAGGGSSRSPASSPTVKVMTNSFSAALSILSRKYKAEDVLLAFDNGFGLMGITDIYDEYYATVRDGLANLVQNIIYYGENNLQVPIIPTFVKGDSVPFPLYTTVPDMYVKQYDPVILEEFPDYILWVGPTGDRIWTIRTEDEPPYKSADEEIFTTTAYEIAAALDPYIVNKNVTPQNVNDILTAIDANVQSKSMNLVVGKNSNTNLLNNLTLILGLLGLLMQLAQSTQLPKTVLDAGKVGIALTAFTRNMAMLKQMKSASASAFTPMTAAAGLGALASLVGQFSSSGLSAPLTGGVSSLFGNTNLNNALLTAAGAAVTVAGITQAMKYSKSNVTTISAASNVLKNMGIAK